MFYCFFAGKTKDVKLFEMGWKIFLKIYQVSCKEMVCFPIFVHMLASSMSGQDESKS